MNRDDVEIVKALNRIAEQLSWISLAIFLLGGAVMCSAAIPG